MVGKTRRKTYKPSKMSLCNGASRASTNTGPSGMINLLIDLTNNEGVIQRVHELVIQRDNKLGDIHDTNLHVYARLTHKGDAVEYFQNGVLICIATSIGSLDEINEEVKIVSMLHDELPYDGGGGKPDSGGMFCSRFMWKIYYLVFI